MKTTKTHGILLGLGVLGISTLFGAGQTPTAQADEFRHAQVQEIQFRRDNRWPNRRPGRRPVQVNQTYYGRVTKDLKGNDFMMQVDGGRTIRVLCLNGEPRGLDRNDRVRVSGYFNNNGVLQANRAEIVRNR